jgi:hypothetical protein
MVFLISAGEDENWEFRFQEEDGNLPLKRRRQKSIIPESFIKAREETDVPVSDASEPIVPPSGTSTG